MPKQTKNTKKVVSLNNKPPISTPLGVVLVVVAGALLAVAGTFLYSAYRTKDLKAKAASFTTLPGFYNSGVTVSACRKQGGTPQSFNITVIGTKNKNTRLVKTLKSDPEINTPADTSDNPVYAVYLPREEKPVKVKGEWSREDDVKYLRKDLTQWWGQEVNVQQFKDVPTTAKIAAQGASDQGGLKLYNDGSYELRFDKIYAPNPSDYFTTNGNKATETANWNKAVAAWESRTKNVKDLAICQ